MIEIHESVHPLAAAFAVAVAFAGHLVAFSAAVADGSGVAGCIET